MTLGNRLRRIRTNGKWSVRVLASEVGLSPSFIYQLEQDQVMPSFSTLKSIARAMNTSVGELVGDEQPEGWMVVRESARRRIASEPGITLEYAAFMGTRHRMMQPLILTVEPQQSYQCALLEHEREEMVFMLSGELVVRSGDKEMRITSGDVAYFMFESVTSFENNTFEPARALWVVSPAHGG